MHMFKSMFKVEMGIYPDFSCGHSDIKRVRCMFSLRNVKRLTSVKLEVFRKKKNEEECMNAKENVSKQPYVSVQTGSSIKSLIFTLIYSCAKIKALFIFLKWHINISLVHSFFFQIIVIIFSFRNI